MNKKFNEAVKNIHASGTTRPYLLMVQGSECNTNCDLFLMLEISNQITKAMACPLPGTQPEKIDLGFSTGTIGINPSYSYFLFANKDMCDLAKTELEEQGYKPEFIFYSQVHEALDSIPRIGMH